MRITIRSRVTRIIARPTLALASSTAMGAIWLASPDGMTSENTSFST